MTKHRIDLEDLATSARQANGTFTVGNGIVPSLIARIRELEDALRMQCDRLDAFHESYTKVKGDPLGVRQILDRGTVLLPETASWSPAVGDLVRSAAVINAPPPLVNIMIDGVRMQRLPSEVGTITAKQPGPRPLVVTWSDGFMFAYRANELVRDELDQCVGCGKRAILERRDGGIAQWMCSDCERKAEAARACRNCGATFPLSPGRPGRPGCAECHGTLDEMLPCQFCRDRTLTVGLEPGAGFPCVTCLGCGARGPLARSSSNREAIANWNRRPGPR